MTEKWEPKERKSFPFELEEKGIDLEERTFAGYAAVCGNLDDGGDIIKSGAFKKTLAERGPDSPKNRVKIFWCHDIYQPIGKPIELREVPRGKLPASLREAYPSATGGLFVKGQISRVPKGDEALTLMHDSVLNEMSIMFDSVKEAYEDDEETGMSARHLNEIKLYATDPIPIAMNAATTIVAVKSAWEEKVEETDDFIHVPVPGEEGKHDDHRIRYIDIDADKGIRAKYCGECKKVISYVFAKEKGWTVKKAVAWVKEHHEKSMEIIVGVLEEEQRENAKAAIIEARIQGAKIQRQEIEAQV